MQVRELSAEDPVIPERHERRRAPASARDDGAARRGSRATVAFARGLGLLLLMGLVGVNLLGFPYYLAPAAVRVRSPLHAWLRPSGPIGQTIGLIALGLFLFLWLYPLRKKLGARVARAGPIAAWLDVHIVAGLLVPVLAATHAGWRFNGLIGLGYLALFIVFLSGLAGRYLYAHIPRSRSGIELTREDAGAERRALLQEIARETGLSVPQVEGVLDAPASRSIAIGPLRAVATMIRDDVARRRAVRALGRHSRGGHGASRALDRAAVRRVASLARREIALGQQLRMLDAAHRVFRYWHAAHKPFAVTALGAVLLHVAVAVAVGATWFW